MTDIIKTILSKLPKHSLIVIIITLGTLLIGKWYKDYTQRQDTLKNDLNSILTGQQDIRKEVSTEFRTLSNGVDELKQGQAAINIKIDILKLVQDKPIQQQIENVDNLVEMLEVKTVQDLVPELEPIDRNHTLLDNEINESFKTLPTDTIKKRGFIGRMFDW